MLERLTDQAMKAMMLAEEESRASGHNFIGTEQILLGLMAEGHGVAARALGSFGLQLKPLRAAVLEITGRGDGFVSRNIPLTPRAQRVLELAGQDAKNLRSKQIGTEHILLGLLHEGSGVASRVLCNFDVQPGKLWTTVTALISRTDAAISPEPAMTLPFGEEYPRAESAEEALSHICGQYSFLKADAVPEEMLGWLSNKDLLIGVYINTPDDCLVVCKKEIHWCHGDAITTIEHRKILSVELPTEDEQRYVKVVLRPKDSVVLLPVQHDTEGIPDYIDMYEYLSFLVRAKAGKKVVKMNIQDIKSREDFIFYLRQDKVRTPGFEELARWLERGDPKPAWLESVNIAPHVLQDESVWRLLALVLLRFPNAQPQNDHLQV